MYSTLEAIVGCETLCIDLSKVIDNIGHGVRYEHVPSLVSEAGAPYTETARLQKILVNDMDQVA